MTPNKNFLTAADVSEYMGISVPMAYKIIRKLNDELKALRKEIAKLTKDLEEKTVRKIESKNWRMVGYEKRVPAYRSTEYALSMDPRV